MLRIQSVLSPELEALTHDVIGCCITVHRELGPGLLERVYGRAVPLELRHAGISFETDKRIPVMYRGKILCRQTLDVVVAGQLVLELKSVEHLAPVHRAQLICYLKISQLPVGLLINFNVPILQDGIKRIVL
jgi:GxxExxY protein